MVRDGMTKTIFISSFEGLETKNVLRTSIFTTLVGNPDIRIVVFTGSEERAAYHRREFDHPRIRYEVVGSISVRGLDRVFSWLKFLLLDTPSTRLRRRIAYERHGSILRYCGGMLMARLSARRSIRRIARLLDYALVRDRTYDSYFTKYAPRLVLLANLFHDDEAHFLRAARRFRVATVGFINSWDKPTTRCALRLLPERFVVFNAVVKDELVVLHDARDERIFIGGIPQYDSYYRDAVLSRGEFLVRRGIDPEARLILYAPVVSRLFRSEWPIIDRLDSLARTGAFGERVVFMVRFHPADRVDPRELMKRPGLRYDFPGTRFASGSGRDQAVEWDWGEDEFRNLSHLLRYASLLICYASSISVDAAICDTPVININYEMRPDAGFRGSPLPFYGMIHYQKALAAGGIRLVGSEEELIALARRYLADPALDREGRRRLARQQCYFMDGKSGERIGNFLLSQM
mgnify:FL=1